MSIADYIVLALVLTAVFFALRAVRRQKKKGGCCGCSGCSGGCAGCPSRGKK